MGIRPKKSDNPPKIMIDPILAARWSSMVDVQRGTEEQVQTRDACTVAHCAHLDY